MSILRGKVQKNDSMGKLSITGEVPGYVCDAVTHGRVDPHKLLGEHSLLSVEF